MRIAAALMIAALSTAAWAADQAPPPVKTPPQPVYPAGFGYYVGLGTSVESSNSSIAVGGVSTNLNSSGAALEGVVGIQYLLPGKNFGFTEVGVSYANLGGSTICNTASGGGVACGINNPWSFSLSSEIGFNWMVVLDYMRATWGSVFGTSPSSFLPVGLQPVATVPYIGLSGHFNQMTGDVPGMGATSTWQATPAIDMGVLNYLANGAVIDARVYYEFANTSFNITPGVSAAKGGTIGAKLLYKF